MPPLRATFVAAAAEIAAGAVDRGLEIFVDAVEGAGTWRLLPAATKQELRDNATTLIGQIDEQRQPYARESAEAIVTPTLLIEGGRTKPASARNVRVLGSHIRGARRVTIPNATHTMFRQDPVAFSNAVLSFIRNIGAVS